MQLSNTASLAHNPLQWFHLLSLLLPLIFLGSFKVLICVQKKVLSLCPSESELFLAVVWISANVAAVDDH